MSARVCDIAVGNVLYDGIVVERIEVSRNTKDEARKHARLFGYRNNL
jgi:hypothetical protein